MVSDGEEQRQEANLRTVERNASGQEQASQSSLKHKETERGREKGGGRAPRVTLAKIRTSSPLLAMVRSSDARPPTSQAVLAPVSTAARTSAIPSKTSAGSLCRTGGRRERLASACDFPRGHCAGSSSHTSVGGATLATAHGGSCRRSRPPAPAVKTAVFPDKTCVFLCWRWRFRDALEMRWRPGTPTRAVDPWRVRLPVASPWEPVTMPAAVTAANDATITPENGVHDKRPKVGDAVQFRLAAVSGATSKGVTGGRRGRGSEKV